MATMTDSQFSDWLQQHGGEVGRRDVEVEKPTGEYDDRNNPIKKKVVDHTEVEASDGAKITLRRRPTGAAIEGDPSAIGPSDPDSSQYDVIATSPPRLGPRPPVPVRRITKVSTNRSPDGKWVKTTEYDIGQPMVEEVEPTVSVATREINGIPFSVEITRPPSGQSTFRYTNLNTGEEVATLPIDTSATAAANKPVPSYQKGGDGKIYPVMFDPSTGKFSSGPALDIPPETPDDRVDLREVPGPNGEKYLVITRVPKDTTKSPVIKTYGPDNKEVPGGVPVAAPPPTSSGMFIPDPRKPAMGLSEHLQHLAQLRNENKLTEKQYADLFATAHAVALSEATRLDVIVRAQQTNTQNLITQRANDLQAAGTRLNYTGTATNNAYDTALKIAGALTPKSLKAAGGGSILGSIMATQDMRAQQSGGFFTPPPIALDPKSAAGQIQGLGLGAMQSGVNQAAASAAAGQAQTQAATTAQTPGLSTTFTAGAPSVTATGPVGHSPVTDRTSSGTATAPATIAPTTPAATGSQVPPGGYDPQAAAAGRSNAAAASPIPTATPPVAPIPVLTGTTPDTTLPPHAVVYPGGAGMPNDAPPAVPYTPPAAYPGAEGDVPKIMSGAAPGSSQFSPGAWFSPGGQQQGIQANAMAMKSLGDNDERPDDMLHVVQTYPNGATVHWSIRRSDYEARSESERQSMQVIDVQPDPRWTQPNQVGKPDQYDGGLIVGARPASTEDAPPITVQSPQKGSGSGDPVYPAPPPRPLITVPGEWPAGIPWQPAGSAPAIPQPRYPYPDQPPYIQTPYNPAPGEPGHQPGQPVGLVTPNTDRMMGTVPTPTMSIGRGMNDHAPIREWFGQPPAPPNWFSGSTPPQTNQAPIPGVASMHPIVGPLMQQYAHDPDYQQALMQAASQGGLL